MASAPDGQLQMSAITLLFSKNTEPLTPVPIEPESPADSLPAIPAGVARMYEAIRDHREDLTGFAHAVHLHQLLDTITEAAKANPRHPPAEATSRSGTPQ